MPAKINRNMLIQVATLYYLGNMPQEKLAEMMGVSRTKISRILKQCREQKIVEFKINASSQMMTKLENTIKEALGVSQVIVVPSAATSAESRRMVGARSAEYLAMILKSNMTVGIAWGSTIRSMVEQMKSAHLAENVEIIQLSGGMNLSTTECNERELTKVLAMKLDAKCHVFQAPILVQNPLLRSLLLQEPELQHHFSLFDKVDVAFLGVGSCNPYESMMYKAGYLSLEETRRLIDMNAIGDLCGHRISPEGKHVETFLDERILAIDLDRLHRIPHKVVLAAGGNKAASIIAACRGGYADVVIMDEIAAISVDHMLGLQEPLETS